MGNTCADIIKEILDAYDWDNDNNYNDTPAVGVVGISLLDQLPDVQVILLSNVREKHDFAGGSESIIATYSQSELTLIEISTERRDNLYEAVKTCFQASSYSIIYEDVKHNDILQPYSTTMRVKLLNGLT